MCDEIVVAVGHDSEGPPLPSAERLRPQLLGALCARGAASVHDGVLLVSDGLPRPLPALLRRGAALAGLRAVRLDAGPALRDVVSGLDVELLDETWWRAYDPTGSWRDDIDRPEDLDAG